MPFEDIGCIHNIKYGIIPLKWHNWLKKIPRRALSHMKAVLIFFAKWIDIFPAWYYPTTVELLSWVEINISHDWSRTWTDHHVACFTSTRVGRIHTTFLFYFNIYLFLLQFEQKAMWFLARKLMFWPRRFKRISLVLLLVVLFF